jgi:DNA-binding beta-propeller fold protein YncE
MRYQVSTTPRREPWTCRGARSLVFAALAACNVPKDRTPPSANPPPAAEVVGSAVSAPAPGAPTAGEPSHAPDAGPAPLTFRPLALPGATPPVSLDYLAYDRANERVWVPVGDTGSADVLDIATGTFTRVDGFKTGEREVRGKKRAMGPSAASVGDGFVYVGNRATSEVCPVDARKLTLGKCLKLASATDGVAYVALTKEVWVTTPHDRSIAVLDASNPAALGPKTVIRLEGSPEGYAVDDARGLFFTNLEDKDRTLVIDVKTHKLAGVPWKPACGADGPRGIAVEAKHGFVFVACTDHVVVLDGAHDGAMLEKLETDAGVDNIDWLEARRLLFVAAAKGGAAGDGAAKAGRMTVAHVDDEGHVAIRGTGDSPEGARNPVADDSGNAYVGDPANARLLVFPAL